MTFSLSARPQQATGTKKHQMSVTHRTLGLHKPGNPRNGPKASMLSSRGWPLGTRREVMPAVRNGVEGTSWEPTWRRCAGKGLSMRSFISCPHSQGLHAATVYADTVKAEKGKLCVEGKTLTIG